MSARQKILNLMFEQVEKWWYGLEIREATRLPAGEIYAVLARLEQQRIVESRWEENTTPGQLRRRLYRLTRDGRRIAQEELEKVTRLHQHRQRPGFSPA